VKGDEGDKVRESFEIMFYTAMSNNFNSSNLDIKCRIVLCKFNNKQIKQQHIHLLQQLL